MSSPNSNSPSVSSKLPVTVILNVVGLSRGGIAAIQLAQLLHNIPPNRLQINLLLFDPVPGNLLTSSKYFDLLGINTANSSLGLTYCHNLRDVLALYPFRPLPDYTCHAPVLPNYPTHPECYVEEDAVLGCHQGALFCQHRSIESRLSYCRIHEWLEMHGTMFIRRDQLRDDSASASASSSSIATATGATVMTATATATTLGDRLYMSPVACKQLMDEVVQSFLSSTATATATATDDGKVRYTHSSPPGAVIVLHHTQPVTITSDEKNKNTCTRWYLNKYHQQLSKRLVPSDDSNNEVKPEDEQKDMFILEVLRAS